MTQTALDDFAGAIKRIWPVGFTDDLDIVVACARARWPSHFTKAQQDPRYLAFCEKQEERERKQRGWEACAVLGLPAPGPLGFMANPPEQDRKEEVDEYWESRREEIERMESMGFKMGPF